MPNIDALGEAWSDGDEVDEIEASPAKATAALSIEEVEAATEQLENDLNEEAEKATPTPKQPQHQEKKKSKKAASKAQEVMVADVDEDEGFDEDEFEVEAIKSHEFKGKGIFYLVKWKGWADEDSTLEPEENLLPDSAEILQAYFDSIGGRPQKETRGRKGKNSLARAATEDNDEVDHLDQQRKAKKQRTSARSAAAARSNSNGDGDHGDDNDNEEAVGNWVPAPKFASWDDLIDEIETVERDENGNLHAYIKFRNKRKSKVGPQLYYKHCPRKMLEFYEKHLSV